MNREQPSTFNREVVVAALLSAVGVVALANHWLVGLIGAYLIWLSTRSTTRSGRLTVLLVWLLGTAATLWLPVNPQLAYAWHLLMISVARSLLFYPRPLALLADLTLSATAGFAALWVLGHSGSLLLTIWTFFLLQAGWVWISDWQGKRPAASTRDPAEKQFDSAHASAVAAIRRLSQ